MSGVGQAAGTVTIGGRPLTLNDASVLASGEATLALAQSAPERIEASRRMVERALAEGQTIYGVTTGFGALSDRTISPDGARELQANLLRSHASGTGTPLEDDTVRLMLALRAHALAFGYSGVRRELLHQLIEMYNRGVVPIVPCQGSVGASGDLAPLAHLALPLIGEGRARVNGEVMDGADALRAVGLDPISLEPKEALALINGTQTMTAVAALAWTGAKRTLETTFAASALTAIALGGRVTSFDALIQQVRPHKGQAYVASRMRALLQGWDADSSTGRPVQDRYSLRAIPQVLGAVHDTLTFVQGILETEINSVTDNPLFFPDEDRVINGANFHGHPIALTSDHLKTAFASLTTLTERRIASLVDPRSSGLPAFLAESPGMNSGLMIAHYLSASLVSENRVLAHPSSVDSLSTSADVEDYNSMGTIAARNLQTVIENASKVVAIELMCAAQAIDLRGLAPDDAPAWDFYRAVRRNVPFLDRDRFGIGDWVEDLAFAIRSGALDVPDGNDQKERLDGER